jgi:hypothetical protein
MLLAQYLNRRGGGGTGDRVAAIGAAVAARLPACHEFRPCRDAADRESRGHTLGHDHNVGFNVKMLVTKPLARAAKASLHLVGD